MFSLVTSTVSVDSFDRLRAGPVHLDFKEQAWHAHRTPKPDICILIIVG